MTGAGIVRDLAMRGVDCLLVERRDVNAGASGANHGLLHSGARYVGQDQTAAAECRREGVILKKLAPQCIEDTGGLFVAVEGDDEKTAADFPGLCEKCGILTREVSPDEAREMEPILSSRIIAAYHVEDAAIDPFMLSLQNVAHAMDLGAAARLHSKVVAFTKSRGQIQTTRLLNMKTGEEFMVEAEQVVNATGAWAHDIAALADVHIDIINSKGSLVITNNRIAERVINRLRPSSDADILVPGGTVSILGTTSIRVDNLDDIRPTIEEIDQMVDTAAPMIPSLQTTRFIRAYAGVRPLVGMKPGGDDRTVSRGFALIDHGEDGLENFTTISGGKLTTYRLMAEKTTDLVCRKLGVDVPCETRVTPLPHDRASQWTRPGLAPKKWLKQHEVGDMLLCECEMSSKSVVDSLIDSMRARGQTPDLRALGLRSRIGKGSCQGAFCGARITGYRYDRGDLQAEKGMDDLKTFLRGRWKGLRP
ncbi:MAG: anaerobic glycerol-3-phosphate dehydrogenase subunit A, partial [Desulfobacterales bacterium]|nr:anaerobic glycerol-3-phosphate dehydrogenase subunit A [Desulfobacterales bacterium]